MDTNPPGRFQELLALSKTLPEAFKTGNGPERLLEIIGKLRELPPSEKTEAAAVLGGISLVLAFVFDSGVLAVFFAACSLYFSYTAWSAPADTDPDVIPLSPNRTKFILGLSVLALLVGWSGMNDEESVEEDVTTSPVLTEEEPQGIPASIQGIFTMIPGDPGCSRKKTSLVLSENALASTSSEDPDCNLSYKITRVMSEGPIHKLYFEEEEYFSLIEKEDGFSVTSPSHGRLTGTFMVPAKAQEMALQKAAEEEAAEAVAAEAVAAEAVAATEMAALADAVLAEAKPLAAGSDAEAVQAEPTQAPEPPPPPARAEAYPAPCEGLDMNLHVEIKKDEGWCTPSLPALVALIAGKKFPGVPDGYDDDNSIAILGKPDKRLDESSGLSSKERKGLARETKSTLFYTTLSGSTCDPGFVSSLGKLSLTCDVGSESFYTAKPPTVKRTVECETMEGDSCGECDSHSDCDGWFCGCSRSRCTIWGICTGCPSERMCEDPEYDVRTKDWKLSAKFKDDRKEVARKIADDSYSEKMLLVFKVQSLWRKTRMGKECEEDWDGKRVCEKVVEHDTGYYAKITPTYLGFMNCSGDACTPGSATPKLNILTKSFKATFENDGHKAVVSCKGGTCTAKKKK